MRDWIAGFTALLLLAAGPSAAQDNARQALGAAYEAAMAATPAPRLLERDQADWLRYAEDDPEVLYQRLNDLRATAERDGRVRTLRIDAAHLADGCVDIGLSGCTSEAGGYLTQQNGPVLHWQLQNGFTETDGGSGGFVLLAPEPAGGTLVPVAWSTAQARYDPPRWAGETGGALVVAVPGTHHGTGAMNADMMFRWEPQGAARLVQIDNMSWRDALDDQLPEGLEVWKGVRFLYDALVAHTPLWLSSDANCCPRGGEALLDFALEGDRLVLTKVHVTDAAAVLAERVPADAFAWVQRRMSCAHWAGEEAYDADRAAQIAAANESLRCAVLEEDLDSLLGEHGEDAALLQLLDRASVW